MQNIITLLPESVANQIAAGEVVQRPSSIVKELLENAIDAKATFIKLIVKDAGKTLVQVIDNGIGMNPVDARMAFERHATSKIKKAEAISILKALAPTDVLILLDEKGKMLSSPMLANLIQQKANQSAQKVVFLIGGAYGVADDIKTRAQFTWSLSALVFPHMLVRLILAEQIYRACSILANEKYHHE
ncbi:MAG: 23S rRNA (pseudouridine(1915)-N(3))-methyltransferase RlmH [Sediminibacterium sp.]